MATATHGTTGRRPGRPPKDPTPQPALIEHEGPERPTEHNGVAIDREEPIMNLPGAPFRISRIFLVNGETAHACRDCAFTADGRGGVMLHRNREHGARIGHKQPKVTFPVDKQAPDPVLPPREDGPAPSNPMEWTLGELLALVPNLGALGDLVERAENERDEAMSLLGDHRRNQYKIDTYDEIRDELTAAKVQLRQWGNYEEVKAEMYALRAWKKKMITKLSALGFQLTEEDQ